MIDTQKSLQNIELILFGMYDHTQEDMLSLYLNRAINLVLRYCNIAEIPDELVDIVEDITVMKYRKRGSEVVSSEPQGSLSENYINSLPQDINQSTQSVS